MRHVLVIPTCEHDGDARRLENGQPRCPMCRAAEKRAAWLAAQAAEEEARRADRAAAWSRTLEDKP